MKINFICNNCGETFNVSTDYLLKKDCVVCPNCSIEFPKDSFNDLKEGVRLIHKSRNELPLQDLEIGFASAMSFKVID